MLTFEINMKGFLPLCLGLEKNKSRIEAILKVMSDPKQLCDDHGLLSLSKKGIVARWLINQF